MCVEEVDTWWRHADYPAILLTNCYKIMQFVILSRVSTITKHKTTQNNALG